MKIQRIMQESTELKRYRHKNELLVEARERLGLTIEKVALTAGIRVSTLCDYENLKKYPSLTNQIKICEFYRDRGIFLSEHDVFPKSLSKDKLSISIGDFVNLSELSSDELSTYESGLSAILERESLRDREEKINRLQGSLILLTNKQQQVIRGLLGLDGIAYSITELMTKLSLSNSEIFRLRAKAIKTLSRSMAYYTNRLPKDS